MSGVIPRNLKQKRRLYLKPFSWYPQTRHTHRQTHTYTHAHTHTHTQTQTYTHTHTHTHTHDDSIRRNAMRCISPKTHHSLFLETSWKQNVYQHTLSRNTCLDCLETQKKTLKNVSDLLPGSVCEVYHSYVVLSVKSTTAGSDSMSQKSPV